MKSVYQFFSTAEDVQYKKNMQGLGLRKKKNAYTYNEKVLEKLRFLQ